VMTATFPCNLPISFLALAHQRLLSQRVHHQNSLRIELDGSQLKKTLEIVNQ
jgi:hypothetical protein